MKSQKEASDEFIENALYHGVTKCTKAARRILVLILKTSVISLWPLWLCGKKKLHIEGAMPQRSRFNKRLLTG